MDRNRLQAKIRNLYDLNRNTADIPELSQGLVELARMVDQALEQSPMKRSEE